ncbi:MAG: magnesium/cobalt transporter CorA [Treponema sp.]|nr:magnesium/cobalt transporter CorA [Treponema sp.]
MALMKSKYMQVVNPVYTGDRPASEMKLSYINYDSTSAETKDVSSIDEVINLKDDSKMLWINISGLKDTDSIKRLGELLEIHPLTIEDILQTEQQAKMEVFDKYRFLLVKTIIQKKNTFNRSNTKRKMFFLPFRKDKRFVSQDGNTDELIITQVGIVIMKNVLLTFQELSRGAFEGIRRKILENTGEIRKMETDYLAYLIIDKIVDEYFNSINHLEEHIENLEERATRTSDDTYIEEIQETKKYLLLVKKAILPLKNNLLIISRQESFFQTGEIKPFLQDLLENLDHAVMQIEHYREWLSSVMEVNLSVLSYQLNKVMKVLAMISAIFIPLSFIAGIYGMNFDVMPELRYNFGYFIVLGVMFLVATIMIIVFKIRKWF